MRHTLLIALAIASFSAHAAGSNATASSCPSRSAAKEACGKPAPDVATAINARVAAKNGTSINQALTTPSLTGGTLDGTQTIKGKTITNPSWLGFQTAYSTTITVCALGCNYAKVSDGFGAALSRAHTIFGINGVVTVSIADGTYTETGQIYTDDPLARRVNIIGNINDNSKVIINFTGGKGTNNGGFVADNGGGFGLINGVTLNQIGTQTAHTTTATSWADQSYGAGIIAEHGATITLGSAVTVNAFYYSIVADDGGVINARSGGVTGTDAGDVNFMARGNGVLVCTPCTAKRAVDMTDPSTAVLGGGFDAERGGTLYIDGSTCTDSNVACVTALTNGKAWAHNMKVSAPLRPDATTGFWSIEGGSIEAQDSKITKMWNGILAGDHGYVECDKCTIISSGGDGVVADGGNVEATSAKVSGSAGYGYHAFHQGYMRLTRPSAGASSNASGNFSVEKAGINASNKVPYVASGIVTIGE